jgi:hypothetical protein
MTPEETSQHCKRTHQGAIVDLLVPEAVELSVGGTWVD